MSNSLPSTLRRAAAVPLTAMLLLASCGGDDDADATPQERLTDAMVEGLDIIDGLDIDEDCVAAKVDELTDEQVEAMQAAIDEDADAPADLADWNTSLGDDCISVSE